MEQQSVDITGNLVFSSNNTGVEDISLLGFVVSPDDIQDVSPSRLEGRFGSTITTSQGLLPFEEPLIRLVHQAS